MASIDAEASACSSSTLEQEISVAAVGHAHEPPQHVIVPLNLVFGEAADNETHPRRPPAQLCAPAPAPDFNVKLFESQVRSAKQRALQVASLQFLSRFLGFCSLTWATVVLLGGFASALRLLDFFLISALLLLEAIRLFIVQIFSKLLSRALFREDRLPKAFKFTDRQPCKALLLDLLGQGISVLLAAAILISSILRLFLSRGHPLSEKNPMQNDGVSNVPTSLYTFYLLVILNSVIAIVSSLLRPFLRQRCHEDSIFRLSSAHEKTIKQNILVCFHDEVYKMAMEAGLPEADQLDILDFAFTKLASDHKRNIRPPLIKELNRDVIRYLYHVQHGIAMVCEYLKSGDVWKQLVAANLPGFWAEEPRIRLQVALFWTLRERMYGGGKDAEAALNSIGCLGQAWAADAPSRVGDYPFLLNDPATATNVVDTLVSLILVPIRPTLFFQVRAFEACCRHPKVLEYLHREGNTDAICAGLQDLIVGIGRGKGEPQTRQEWAHESSRLRELCCRLHSMVAGKAYKNWVPTRLYASSALLNLLSNGRKERLGAGIKACIATALKTDLTNDPAAGTANGNYFWVEDVKVVERVRFELDLEPYRKWGAVRIIQENGNLLSDPTAIDAIVNEARQSVI